MIFYFSMGGLAGHSSQSECGKGLLGTLRCIHSYTVYRLAWWASTPPFLFFFLFFSRSPVRKAGPSYRKRLSTWMRKNSVSHCLVTIRAVFLVHLLYQWLLPRTLRRLIRQPHITQLLLYHSPIGRAVPTAVGESGDKLPTSGM